LFFHVQPVLKTFQALIVVAALTIGFAARLSGQSSPVQPQPQEYRLRLYHLHTGEHLDIVYRSGDTYLPGALTKLDYFLRDHRTGDVHHFDPRLYDVLEDLTKKAGYPAGEIDVVCGYRSPWSNEFLRRHSAGVAEHSLHVQAEAIDLRMPGVNTYRLRLAALSLRRGGVGYYPGSDFIHVDIGRVRQWCLGCATNKASGD